MRVIADLHIHSGYSRATSKELNLENLVLWCEKKGISVVGTGDFTHPAWFAEIRNKLEEVKPGLYKLKGRESKVLFMCTAEVSSIYKQGDKVRRVHNLLFAPSIEAVEKLNAALTERGVNIKSDGRPIMGLHCPELMKIVKDVHEDFEIIPAHAWTPHFGIFGSLSGFNSIEEAFGDQTKYIFAIETGLSSDPAMNHLVPGLDNISLISNSDPHSLHRLGREANVFEMEEGSLSYKEIIRVIRDKNPKEFLYTVEFYPEEGRYHLDGHADCKFSCEPFKTKELGGMCPVCGKKLLLGVLNRVEALSERGLNYRHPNEVPFRSLVSLEEIIAETLDMGVASKKVQGIYEQAIAKKNEFGILLDLNRSELEEILGLQVSESVVRVREGQLHITPGYDGVYGEVHIYTTEEREKLFHKPKQMGLF